MQWNLISRPNDQQRLHSYNTNPSSFPYFRFGWSSTVVILRFKKVSATCTDVALNISIYSKLLTDTHTSDNGFNMLMSSKLLTVSY